MESERNNSSPLVAVPMRRHLVTLSDATFQQIAQDAHLAHTSVADVLDDIVHAYYRLDPAAPALKVGILVVYLGRLS